MLRNSEWVVTRSEVFGGLSNSSLSYQLGIVLAGFYLRGFFCMEQAGIYRLSRKD